MDFDKIKSAAEEISLDELQKERILAACRKTKRKKSGYKIWISVAAAAVFAVVLISPGFLFRAKSSNDSAESFNNNLLADQEIEFYAAEEEIFDEAGNGIYHSASLSCASLFSCNGYREIYSVIPEQFTWLVDADEYKLWKSRVKASGGMAMLQFVEYFGIPREDFDAANDAYAAYLDSTPESAEEAREIFNADIIYSFDREKIDEYYSAN